MIRITTLSENTAISAGMKKGLRGSFLAEWGLSILIETDNTTVLLDTGKSISATHNADTLGINLNKIDKIVLSHSHPDHTGGLLEMLRRIRKNQIEIIAHPHVWANRYNLRNETEKFSGIPFQRQELENYGAVFTLTAESVKLSDNMLTTGEVPMVTEFEKTLADNSTTNRFIKKNGEVKPDNILDDQAIIIKTDQGLAVISGCAHRGIINTIRHAQQLTGIKTIHSVIGGSHLVQSSGERIRQTIAALKELEVQKLGLCHCTSLQAMTALAHEFGDKFFFNNAGTQVELP
ncbi:MAG: MBL fold metallo-hydrolase [Desulfobacterales bacterium]